jgi:hypothetical protein
MTAVTYANKESAVTQDGQPPTERQVAPRQTTMDATRQAARAQERYYSTWGYSNSPALTPAKPSRRPDWLVPGLGGLAAAVTLSAGLAVLAAKRARRRARVGQAA